MLIVTDVVSLAVTVNDGFRVLDGEAGWFSVTVGAAVSTVNLTASLLPSGLPSELGCVATAVYWPSFKAGLAGPEVQLPATTVPVALAATVPSGLLPAEIVAGTGVGSGAVRLNGGVAWLER